MESRKKVLLSSSISISILTLVYILIFSPYRLTSATFVAIKTINPLFLTVALGMHMLAWLIWSLRQKVISDFIDKSDDLRFTQSVKIVLTSLFAACITPSQFGGEPVRIYLLKRNGLTVGDSTAVVLGERSQDFMVGMAGAAMGFILFRAVMPRHSLFFTIMGIILLLGVILIAYGLAKPDRLKLFINWLFSKLRVHRMERVRDWLYHELENFYEAHKRLRREGKKTLITAFILTVAFWLVEFSIPSFLLLGLGADPFWIYSVAAQFIILVIAAVPLSPGSSGISELSIAYLYHTLVGTHLLGLFTLLLRLSTYYASLIAGAIASMKVMTELQF